MQYSPWLLARPVTNFSLHSSDKGNTHDIFKNTKAASMSSATVQSVTITTYLPMIQKWGIK